MIKDAYNETIKTFRVEVVRQNRPGERPYSEVFSVEYEPDMNVISVLQKIAARPVTVAGKPTTPVAWDCGCLEEVCGACTMVINGQVRQSCSALVDQLLAVEPRQIRLEPMGKFPVIRDLVVDRKRIFHNLKRVRAWVEVDGYFSMGPGPNQGQHQQEENYPLSECMSCGCCMEACPQFLKIDKTQMSGESENEFSKRVQPDFDQGFLGAHAISQAVLFNNHPIGKLSAGERLDALTAPGGIQLCGNAQNCVAVCPKHIPLTTSIGRAGRAVTIDKLKKIFGA